MIDFDFEYYQPNTIREAVYLFDKLDQEGKKPVYYSGGTELLTFGRLNYYQFGSVIDLKGIDACQAYGFQGDQLVIGACVTLNRLSKAPLFPLLAETASQVADHTSRNKITVGGNATGEIIYKEALLPFLLAESELVIAGRQGIRTIPVMELFNQSLQLNKGEILLQFLTDRARLHDPYFTVKKRKLDRIDYPLLTLAALKTEGHIRVAISGLLPYPIRFQPIEEILNIEAYDRETKIEQVIGRLPGPVLNDWIGSSAYRLFVLKNTLEDMFDVFEKGGTIGESTNAST
jgi:CO/xanthine dehydrogenase FAD-binding subunit